MGLVVGGMAYSGNFAEFLNDTKIWVVNNFILHDNR